MARSLTLELEPFGLDEFAEFAERQGGSPSRVAALAARYYLGDPERGQPAWPVPRPARKAARKSSRPGLRIELDVATWNALLEEARRQDVGIRVLAEHAVLYFMADYHAGRVAQRMADAVAEPRRR